jgi:unsaturated chondroitin disaccharide hydrolase
MIRYILTASLSLALFLNACNQTKPDSNEEITFADKQLRFLLSELDEIHQRRGLTDNQHPRVIPRSVRHDELYLVPSTDWTSGFFPGVLWQMYAHTGNDYWREVARKYTALVENEKFNDGTHDIGFMIYNSAGQGYRLTGETHYRDIVVQAASSLASRFNDTVGAIRSWDLQNWPSARERWDYAVIIDNMMNLELLFRATEITGDSLYYDIAFRHAKTTLKNHFRDDFSSYHVVDYDENTGEIRNLNTHQGASNESAWARGQAWGLYGFSMAYRFTSYPAFLEQAKNIAFFILNHPNLPDDLVPYWDFDAPSIPHEPRDVSSATVIASALYELGTFVPEHSYDYWKTADQILENITSTYRSSYKDNQGFLLDNSTGNNTPGGYEIDIPIIYADYYYLEALLRKKQLTQTPD